MKKAHYRLLTRRNTLYVCYISEIPTPPAMDVGILDMWVMGQLKDFDLPNPTPDIQVATRDGCLDIEPYLPKGDRIAEYRAGDRPVWLSDYQFTGECIEKLVLLGDPTYYIHCLPIAIPSYEKKRVLVTGVFDLFHFGHLHFLSEVHRLYVANQHRELHIGMGDDTSITYLKGKKPIFSWEQRAAILEALVYVEKVHQFNIWRDAPAGTIGCEDGHRNLLDAVNPVLFVDSFQKPAERIGILPYLKERRIPIQFVNSINLHTVDIIKEIQQ